MSVIRSRTFIGVILVIFAFLACVPARAGANEDLLAAAPKGELDKVQRALKKGASLDARGDKNATALMLAAENNQVEVLRALLAAGADVNATRDGGLTALHGACGSGSGDAVKVLVAAGADVSKASDKGTTPMLAAGMSGKLDILQFLAQSGASKTAVDASGATLLMMTARAGCVPCMDFARGDAADINAATTRGANVLDYALAGRNWAAIQHVLELGGTPSSFGKKNALFAVINNPADQLLKQPPADPALIRALIARGADLEATNQDGLTPLLQAAKSAHVEAVEALLEAKANLAAVDKSGAGVLALTASRDMVENARMLLAISQGGSSAQGMQSMFKPAERSDTSPATAHRLEMTRKLLAAGAAANAADSKGYTPLHRAVMIGDAEMVDLLITAGANLNAVNDAGSTPLILAALWGYDSVVGSLLKAGADVNVKNNNGDTALSVARNNKQAKVVALLEAPSR